MYPRHGAAVIERREHRTVFGQTKEYLVLRVATDDLTVLVPVDNASEVGLRAVVSAEEAEDVFAVLGKESRVPENWSRRFKNHTEKLRSGDIYEAAEVWRNLSVRKRRTQLSAAEGELLARARMIIVSELCLALKLSEKEVDGRLEAALPAATADSKQAS